MKLSVDLVGLTWQDLYNFVDAARAADVPGELEVGQELAQHDEETPVALTVDVHNLDQRSVTFDDTTRRQYADALRTVIDTDGDARAVLETVKDLRDGLLRT